MAGRRRLLFAFAGFALAGCGFQLRRAPEMPFRTIALAGFRPRSPQADELRVQINSSPTTKVVETTAQAQVVLEALEDHRDKSVAAQTAAGEVREFTLRTTLRFRVRTPAGRLLIRDTELQLSRDMTYNETNALAKEQEEAILYRAMQSDIVDQVLRQLAAVTL